MGKISITLLFILAFLCSLVVFAVSCDRMKPQEVTIEGELDLSKEGLPVLMWENSVADTTTTRRD